MRKVSSLISAIASVFTGGEAVATQVEGPVPPTDRNGAECAYPCVPCRHRNHRRQPANDRLQRRHSDSNCTVFAQALRSKHREVPLCEPVVAVLAVSAQSGRRQGT